MFCFVVTLVFVVCSVFCGVVKWCYVPDVYKVKAEKLFPCRVGMAVLFGLQILQIPYLVYMDSSAALTYANVVTLLTFSSMIPVLERRYFMLDRVAPSVLVLYFLPVALTIITALVAINTDFLNILLIKTVTTALFTTYLTFWIVIQRKIYRRLKLEDEEEYSNDDDFPSAYARLVQWTPLMLFAVQLASLWISNPYLKAAHDAILTMLFLWLLINSMNPKRTGVRKQAPDAPKKLKMSQAKATQTEQDIIELVTKDKLFANSHLTLRQIAKALNTNESYVSESIHRGEYGTFYNLINSLRVEHAKSLLNSNPKIKIETVALDSGFSSNSVFTRTFKQITGTTPKKYLSNWK